MYPFHFMDSLHISSEFDASGGLITVANEAVRVCLYFDAKEISLPDGFIEYPTKFQLNSDKEQ